VEVLWRGEEKNVKITVTRKNVMGGPEKRDFFRMAESGLSNFSLEKMALLRSFRA